MSKKVSRSIEVSAKSFLGRPSEMDKTIEKWTSQGWQLKSRTSLGGKKYLLHFEREKRSRAIIPKINISPKGCLGLLAAFFICSVIVSISESIKRNQTMRTVAMQPTAVISATTTQARQINESARLSPTVEMTPTSQVVSTETPIPSNTPTASDTPHPTNTTRPTRTPRPSHTATLGSTPYVISSSSSINARSCASTDCEVVAQLSPGTTISVLGNTAGQAVSGNTSWFEIRLDGEIAYVHSSLASLIVDQTQTSSEVRATQIPATQVASTSCSANFRGPGVNYRLSNSYDGGNYQRYSYVPIHEPSQQIEFLLEVGTEWGPPPFNLSALGFSSDATSLNGVTIDYDFEGEAGWYESIAFSFEYAGLKFGGDVTIFDDLASSNLDPSLIEEMTSFVQAIMRMC